MNEEVAITLTAAEAERLLNQYYNLAGLVRSLALAEVLKLVKTDPERLAAWQTDFERSDDRIASQFSEFGQVLRRALQRGTEPGTAPNSGPAELPGSSGVNSGPPSVS